MLNEGQAGFSLRCEAWLKMNIEQRPENFRVAKMTPNLTHDEPSHRLIELAEEMGFRPGLIVIDSFSKATFGGDDNSTSEMAGAMGAATQLAAHFGGLVVLVDHVGKDENKGVRGAYAKHANADMVGRVTKKDEWVTLKTTKQREAEADLEFEFGVDMAEMPTPDDPSRTVPTLVPENELEAALAARITQSDFILKMLDAEGAMTRAQFKDRFCERYGKDKVKSFNQVLLRLRNGGKVKEKGDAYVLLD